MGTLTISSFTTTSAAVNLTTLTLNSKAIEDWVVRTALATHTQKSGASLLSILTSGGDNLSQEFDGGATAGTTFSWSDGDSPSSGSESDGARLDVFNSGESNYREFTCTVGTGERTMRVWLGRYCADAGADRFRISASISDASSSDQEAFIAGVTSDTDGYWDITVAANSAGQTLTVRITNQTTASNVFRTHNVRAYAVSEETASGSSTNLTLADMLVGSTFDAANVTSQLALAINDAFIATLFDQCNAIPTPLFPNVTARGSARTASTNTTSHPITLPTHVAGDLLVVHLAIDGNPTVTAPGDWEKLGQASNTTVVTGAIFWKKATSASETLTLTSSVSEQSSHTVLVITPQAGYTLGIQGASANGSSTNSNPPNLAPAPGTKDYLWIVTRAGDSTVLATVAPTSFSQLQSLAAAGTGGASTNTAERQLNASSLDPATFTSASEQWVSWTIAVWSVQTVSLSVADMLTGTVFDVPTLTLSNMLAIQDSTSAVFFDNVTMSSNTSIAPQDMAIATLADSLGISVQAFLQLQEIAISTTADNLTITAENGTAIVISKINSQTTFDSATITTDSALVIADSLIATELAPIVFTLDYTLAIQDALSSLSLDSLNVSQDVFLAIQNALSSTTMQNVTFTADGDLVIQDMRSISQFENIGLGLDTYLAIQDVLSSLSVDAVTLSTQSHIAIAEISVQTLLEAVSLSDEGSLVIDDQLISTSIDEVGMSVETELVTEGILINHYIDNIALSTNVSLLTQDMTHQMLLDTVGLTLDTSLLTNDLLSSVTEDNVLLVYIVNGEDLTQTVVLVAKNSRMISKTIERSITNEPRSIISKQVTRGIENVY